jgi:hypothetical protein
MAAGGAQMDLTERHEGGCLCGAVRFRTCGQPAKAVLCHCRYCQTRTGSAFGISLYFKTEQVELLSGTLKHHAFETESGRGYETRFCTECGTTVFSTTAAGADLTGVAGGCYDPPTFWYDLKREVFTRSAAPFVHTDIADTSETSSSYRPVQPDPVALNGA